MRSSSRCLTRCASCTDWLTKRRASERGSTRTCKRGFVGMTATHQSFRQVSGTSPMKQSMPCRSPASRRRRRGSFTAPSSESQVADEVACPRAHQTARPLADLNRQRPHSTTGFREFLPESAREDCPQSAVVNAGVRKLLAPISPIDERGANHSRALPAYRGQDAGTQADGFLDRGGRPGRGGASTAGGELRDQPRSRRHRLVLRSLLLRMGSRDRRERRRRRTGLCGRRDVSAGDRPFHDGAVSRARKRVDACEDPRAAGRRRVRAGMGRGDGMTRDQAVALALAERQLDT
jgi:hypothetical protein